ncbi:MAG: L,D-transpeptidase family protein [Bacteroidota bacterium]|nr:L,D-transpeptidase family protein [Bacteroidota bacterium]
MKNININKRAPKRGAFLFFCVCISITLWNCNRENENERTVKNIVVKKPEDVNKTTLLSYHEILKKNTSDTLLIYDGDTLLSFPFFERLKRGKDIMFFDKGKLTQLGDSMVYFIRNARHYGLYPQDYHARKLDTILQKTFDKASESYYSGYIAQAELLLTDAYLKFGAHLNKGRFNPDTALIEWKPAKLDTNWLSILKSGVDNNFVRRVFDSLEPRHEGYQFLKYAFLNYIRENETRNWDSVSFFNVKDTTIFLQQLKDRLTATGDYVDSLKVNDSLKLAKALKKFQKRMNLDPDGKMGKYTRQALQLSKEYTIRQMEMALERWRWEPKKYPEKYAMVNIPSANIRVFEWWKKKKQDTLVLLSNVVVGKPETPTPLLQSKINYITIYPYWNVPFTIAWKEILPMVQRDTSYLRRKNFEVIGGNGEVVTNIGKLPWKRYNKEYLPIRFRQRIGDDNSLGVCKFNFNNKYGVYLHDTNSKRYFKTFYRYQSHGCIRLDKYYEMARFLIREDTLKIPYDTLDEWLKRPVQQKITPKKPIPIYVRYYTAQTDSNKNLRFFIDVYRKDEYMIKKLYRKN